MNKFTATSGNPDFPYVPKGRRFMSVAYMPKVYNRKTGDEPATAAYVGRPTPYGNPFVIGKHGTREEVVDKYRQYVRRNPKLRAMIKRRLKGRDLVCWCAPLPCHADVILEIANE